jgi:hypothetical protein
MQPLHATRNGTVLRGSFPSFQSKRYRIIRFSENIKNGDILQVRLLVRLKATLAYGLR